MRKLLLNIPFIGELLKKIYTRFSIPFDSSEDYWVQRYNLGGNSGAGSYNKFAAFKAEIINEFVKKNNVQTIMEFGCGDGNQLTLANYPDYTGFDISPKAISLCEKLFAGDNSKRFKLLSDYAGDTAELVMSLDVIYHLVEDDVYENYIKGLFGSSEKYIVIYSSNTDENQGSEMDHVKHRKFSDWINKNQSDWELIEHIPNRFPMNRLAKGSFADFFIYKRNNS